MRMLQILVLSCLMAAVMAQSDPFAYRAYVYQDLYDKVTLIGGLCCAGVTGFIWIIVLLRDVFKVWSCFGVTEAKRSTIPVRTLTAMSAAYMANQPQGAVTMPVTEIPA